MGKRSRPHPVGSSSDGSDGSDCSDFEDTGPPKAARSSSRRPSRQAAARGRRSKADEELAAEMAEAAELELVGMSLRKFLCVCVA